MRAALPLAIAVASGTIAFAGCGAHHRRVEGPPPEYEVPDEGDAGATAGDGAATGVVESGAAEPPAAR